MIVYKIVKQAMSRYLLNTEKLKNMFYEDNLSLHYLYHNVSKKSRDLFYWWLHYTKHTFYGRDFSKNQKEILNNIYIVKCKSTKCNNWIKENSDCYRCYERKNKKKNRKIISKNYLSRINHMFYMYFGY